MSDEVVVDGISYISSKRASELSGYAQDYIGQLARSGSIEARRVGGLWHVSLESLNAYKSKSEEYKPEPPQNKNTVSDPESFVSLDGKDYISASRASKLTGYNQDYVGQLARSGHVLARQVGNRWYVEKGSLLAHKYEKDSLLGAVQSDSVGIRRPQSLLDATEAYEQPLLNYIQETKDLMPTLAEREDIEEEDPISHSIPIRVVQQPRPERLSSPGVTMMAKNRRKKRPIGRIALAGAALTVVVVLSFGFSTFGNKTLYTLKIVSGTQQALAGASNIVTRVGDILEKWFVRELIYRRAN